MTRTVNTSFFHKNLGIRGKHPFPQNITPFHSHFNRNEKPTHYHKLSYAGTCFVSPEEVGLPVTCYLAPHN